MENCAEKSMADAYVAARRRARRKNHNRQTAFADAMVGLVGSMIAYGIIGLLGGALR